MIIAEQEQSGMTVQRQIPRWQQSMLNRCFHPTSAWEEFPPAQTLANVAARFLEIAARHPDNLALHSTEGTLTYRQLAARAFAIAAAITRRSHDRSNKPVALLMADGATSIAAILGVLLAGRFYTVVNPRLPVEQMAYIFSDTEADLILVDESCRALAESLAAPNSEVIVVEAVGGGDGPEPVTPRCAAPDDLVWLYYTSGSTGRPKGVSQTHENLLHFVRTDTNSLHICPQDRFALLFSLSANIAGHTIFNALLNGAALYLGDLRTDSAAAVVNWVNEHELTQLWVAPTMAGHLFGELAANARMTHVRVLMLAGEATQQMHLAQFRQHTTERCVLVNRFGASETGPVRFFVFSHESPMLQGSIPIGYATEGNEVLLVDEQGRPVVGAGEGEIVVRSRYLSPGYWRLPERTAATFAADPDDPSLRLYFSGDLGRLADDGCLTHLGRKDYQIKIDGNKVHLQAIEARLLEHPAVAGVAVWPYSVRNGAQRLAAYVVPVPGRQVTVSDLRAHLSSHFPAYAIPSRFQQMDALPTAANGKLYRPALPPPDNSRPLLAVPYAPPRTPFETRIAEIWRKILELDRVGIHDPFLELGGNSLQAMRIAVRVQARLGVVIPADEFFAAATVADMALVALGHLIQEVDNDLNECHYQAST